MDRAAFIDVVAHRAVVEILLDEKNLRTAAFKANNARRAKLAAVQADVVRTDSRGQPALVEKFRPPFVDLQPQLALHCVPIEVEIPRQFLCPRSLLRNRRSLHRLGPAPSKPSRHQQKFEPELRHIPFLRTAELFYIRNITMANSYRQGRTYLF